ncbi:methylase [Luminiphilus syltensis NOR5-1B]|uniref:Ribosomal RNA large subunit methyltransferase K/L n=1 Tax=Luminiphilus syltensis NOR5-1B TaxID=565045 RepID=B8KYC8_9GAMM|nr:bifunctional 23S rRNA (guanine(2069)-N(7))-methyltransferase RlmK/23S rRNA (guanine(2445)-N(2))-methyltransferase RlmL [Luminiphilus syltensis]EED36069.1 methylase [Luminiphilus syltensis NOR5-1B]
MAECQFLATCPKGLGGLLAQELESLGAVECRETPAGVAFSGSMALGYRVCLWSRIANRLLLILSQFAAESADDLYEGITRLAWQDHLAPEKTLAVDFSGRSDDIRNTQFGAQRCKDAVVDAIRARRGARPNVDLQSPDLRLNVRLHRGHVSVGIDLSGTSLHRRGYRLDGGKAPLKENLAAAVLMRCSWPELAAQGWPLIDPMCGSGTLLLEAALMAMNCAPGMHRERFGFHGWAQHSEAQWQAIVSDARDQQRPLVEGCELRGYDGDIRAVDRAQENARRLGFEDSVRIRCKPLNELVRPTHRVMPSGLIVCNPPWGERMGGADSLPFLYRQLGETLHREFQGWNAGILTSELALGRAVGLRSHKQYKLNNGAVDVQLLLFRLDAENRLSDPPAAVADPSGKGGDPWKKSHAPSPPETLSDGAIMFANRIKKNRRRLKSWLRTTGTTCYRIYDADIPEYAVAVDVYNDRLHVAEYAPPKDIDEAVAAARFNEAVAVLPTALSLPPDTEIACKRRQRQSGRDQYQRLAQRGERFVVDEGRVKLLVNLHDYLDTGLFLDHRPLRERIGKEARGGHFLNLFCYTGVATLHAALGGAITTTSVDLSNTYLRWFEDNLALNGLSERQHRAIRSDAREFLETSQQRFDLILLDPPSFSNSKSTDESFEVQRDHARLVAMTMKLLRPQGTLYFSNNRRRFKLDEHLETEFSVSDITSQTIPEDFIRRSNIHHCFRIRHCTDD